MAGQTHLSAIVHGRVQGVFFRAFVKELARRLGVTGFVRNLPDLAKVEIEAEGDRANLEALLEQVEVGPPGARVEKVEVEWSEYQGSFSSFEIRY